MSWLIRIYLVVVLGSVGGFGWYGMTGREAGSPERRFVPSDVRAQSRTGSGGYRSFHFWHVGYGGYRGGK